MKLTKTFCLICICLCAGFSTNASNNSIFHLADSLRNAGLYEIAAIEYERVYYSSDNAAIQAQALILKSECLKNLEKFELAEKCLSRINYSQLNDSLTFLAHGQTALCAYLAGNFANAESQLLQMKHYVKDTAKVKQSLLIYALVLNELHKWDEAKFKIFEWIDFFVANEADKESLKNDFEKLYHKKNQPKIKNPQKAKVLSSIIPGSGQMYAGYWGEGAANASLQGLALLLTAYGIYTGFYFTAGIVWFGLFQKFYAGAIMRTVYLTEKRNYQKTRKYNDDLKKSIVLLAPLMF